MTSTTKFKHENVMLFKEDSALLRETFCRDRGDFSIIVRNIFHEYCNNLRLNKLNAIKQLSPIDIKKEKVKNADKSGKPVKTKQSKPRRKPKLKDSNSGRVPKGG